MAFTRGGSLTAADLVSQRGEPAGADVQLPAEKRGIMRLNRQRMTFGALATAAALVLTSATPAGAITGGEPDNGRHPSVGLVLFYEGGQRFRCSGTLIAPKVVLTAAHCTFNDAAGVVVNFSDVIAEAPPSGLPTAADTSVGFVPADLVGTTGFFLGTPLTHPQYSDFTDIKNWNDTGLVYLAEAPPLAVVPLAPVGYLDAVAQPALNKTLFDVVGYGTEVRKPDSGPQKPTPQGFPLIRRFTTSPGQKLTPQILQLNGNINDTRGGGGTCFGDSGGPVILDGFVVADTSYGYTSNCRYLGGYQRVEIPVVADWIQCVLGSANAVVAKSNCGSLGA